MPTLPKRPLSEIYLYQPVMPEAEAVRVGMLYPADTNVAMSSLGYLTLFRQLDCDSRVDARRIAMDTLKQHDPRQLDLLGISFSFELDILAILKALDTWKIPLQAADRSAQHPLVFAGGPVPMSNPEPYADFFDFFLIGEGEDMLRTLIPAFERHRNMTDRQTLLRQLAIDVPGLYAPSLYEIAYEPGGPIQRIEPCSSEVPCPVQKQQTADLDTVITASPILTTDTIFSNTFLIELMRGCAHRCRFCLASYTMLPEFGQGPLARGPALQPVIEAIETGTRYTHKIGLMGALIANHPEFPALCEYLDQKINTMPDLAIAPASLRADTLTLPMARTFQRGKQKKITIAVESGSEKIRKRIHKNLTHDQILHAASIVSEAGLKGLKLYGMIGLPDETDDDALQLADLLKDIRRHTPRLNLVLGCSTFVPKAATPFQWMDRLDNKPLEKRLNQLRKALVNVADFRPSSPRWDYLQAVLSRGDRRLGPLLIRFAELGGSPGQLKKAHQAVRAEGHDLPDLDWYALRKRPQTEILPWDLLHLGVPKEILWREGL